VPRLSKIGELQVDCIHPAIGREPGSRSSPERPARPLGLAASGPNFAALGLKVCHGRTWRRRPRARRRGRSARAAAHPGFSVRIFAVDSATFDDGPAPERPSVYDASRGSPCAQTQTPADRRGRGLLFGDSSPVCGAFSTSISGALINGRGSFLVRPTWIRHRNSGRDLSTPNGLEAGHFTCPTRKDNRLHFSKGRREGRGWGGGAPRNEIARTSKLPREARILPIPGFSFFTGL